MPTMDGNYGNRKDDLSSNSKRIMAQLSSIEKLKLEKFFDMSSGFVLNFSNRTLEEVVLEVTGRDIYDDKYRYSSGSKANRIRAFWNKEPGSLVSKLIKEFLEYWKANKQMTYQSISGPEQILYDECYAIAERLEQEGAINNIDSFDTKSNDKDFRQLSKMIKNSIDRNEPETAIDRLHTFMVRYIRELSDYHSLTYKKETPLHSLFGNYVKFLKENKLIESSMTEAILKSSISVLDAFNDVRNNKSFAHDNPIINHDESILIFNDIANVVRFIDSIELEKKSNPEDQNDLEISLENIPF